MKNVGKTYIGNRLTKHAEFTQDGCCYFLVNVIVDSHPVQKYTYALFPKKWAHNLNWKQEEIKEYAKLCTNSGLPWKLLTTNDRGYILRISNDKMVSGFHLLATFSTIRYMYSPFYDDIPKLAMRFYRDYKVNSLEALMYAHQATKKSYDGYFGLVRGGSGKVKKNTIKRKTLLKNLKTNGVNASFSDFFMDKGRGEIKKRRNVEGIAELYNLKRR